MAINLLTIAPVTLYSKDKIMKNSSRLFAVTMIAALMSACSPSVPPMVQQCGIDPITQQQRCVMVPQNQVANNSGSGIGSTLVTGAVAGAAGYMLGKNAAAPSQTVPVYQQPVQAYQSPATTPRTWSNSTTTVVQAPPVTPAFKPQAAANTVVGKAPTITATNSTPAPTINLSKPSPAFKPQAASYKPTPTPVKPTFKPTSSKR